MINVSALEGTEKINLPREKIVKLFIQFISKAANDEDLKNIVREIYADDIKGISVLMRNAQKEYPVDGFNENKAAYTLLAMIYGLSFFRVTNFMPPGENDNREIAFEFINRLFGLNSY
jgi:TetR/AcrR family transcriptional regulator, transcriptional repressor of bet genes